MSGPSKTVNDLMQFLRDQFHLDAPILPLKGIATVFATVWNMVVSWFPDKQPLPWTIPVEGTWQVPLSTGKTLPLTVSVVIAIDDAASPTHNPLDP